MVTLDVTDPFWVSARYAREHIQSGWIAQYSGEGFVSRSIKLFTQGVHSHSAMLRRDPDGDIDVLELREFKDGRALPLALHLRQPGYRIDIFSCNAGNRWPEFDPVGATEIMRDLTAFSYGWRGIGRMALRRVPFVRGWLDPETRDVKRTTVKPVKPFCSHAVSLATDVGGGVDPVPRLPHSLVAPAHLTNSLFYEYEFSIVTDYILYRLGQGIKDKARSNELRRI